VAVIDSEHFDRTAKLLVDRDGQTIEDAVAELQSAVLQLDIGQDWPHLSGSEAAVLTAINTGRRAFGKVLVRLATDGEVSSGWARGTPLSDAIVRFGGTLCDVHTRNHPTVVVGSPPDPVGLVVIYATWSRWAGGVVDDATMRLDEVEGTALSGALAGSIAVSECFQNVFHNPGAGRRSTGLSLWDPAMHWQDDEAVGPPVKYLPEALWIAGLGHLGQAYAWVLGGLEYPESTHPQLVIQDIDRISQSNISTSLLAEMADIGTSKARLVAFKLDRIGFATRIVERLFDEDTRRQPDEPGLILSGFDNLRSRRAMGAAGFELIIDAGLAVEHDRYLSVLTRSFLRGFDGQAEFRDHNSVTSQSLGKGYEAEIATRMQMGIPESEARCGVIELAGKAVGASFVGAFAACLVLAEAIRPLHGGPAFRVVGTDLGYLAGTDRAVESKRDIPRLGYIRTYRDNHDS
jgi:hypothetical protein